MSQNLLPNDHGIERSGSIRLDLLAVGVLLLIVMTVFHQTLLLGIPISKISILAHWDSFFYDQARGQNMSLDPTMILLHVPFYFLVADIWKSGVLPLWNPLSGCGCPLIGDIESSIFSPLKLLFALHPSLKAYNYILITQVAASALGSYLLSRCLRLSRLSSIFAALTFSFCPHILYYLELANGPVYCFFPVVLSVFVLLSRSISPARIILAALACSLLIFSGHPESAFFGILAGVLLFILLRLFHVFDNDYTPSLLKMLLRLACSIAIVGLFTFAFSAPVLLPFLEYLRNSECYKFFAPYSVFLPWQSVLACLLAPCFAGTSPYLGVAVLPALCAGFFFRSKLWKALVTEALILFLIVTQIGPVRGMYLYGGLATIVTVYALPAFLLVLCLLAAYGVQCFFQESVRQRTVLNLAVFACLLQVALAALIRSHEHSLASLEFNTSFPFDVSRQSLQVIILCSLALALILFSKRIWRNPNAKACAVLIVSWISIAPVIALSLPVEPRFVYDMKEPLAGLNLTNARLVSLGEHLLRPNSNWVFGISDLRCEKSLFPKGNPEFMVACGARVDSHTQIFDRAPGPAFDFAAVPYVLTQSPIVDASDEASARKISISSSSNLITPKFIPKHVREDLELQEARFDYLPDDFALSCSLSWRYNGKDSPPPYSIQFTVSPAAGRPIWSTEFLTLNECPAQLNLGGFGPKKVCASSTNSVIRRHILLLLPTTIPDGSQVHIAMRLFDLHGGSVSTALTPINFEFKVLPQSHAKKKRRFILVKEVRYHTGDIIRLYRNCNAVPQAYLIHNVITAASSNTSANALALMTNPSFNPKTTAIIEATAPTGRISATSEPGVLSSLDGVSSAPQDRQDKVTLHRPNTNCAVADISCKRPGLLVLADTFYPGWHANIDGVAAHIVRCNYLFKGVFVPKGRHRIEFSYLPESFLAGILLAGAAVLLSVAWLLHYYLQKITSAKSAKLIE